MQKDAINYEPINNYCNKNNYIQSNVDYMNLSKAGHINQLPVFVGNEYDYNYLSHVGWGPNHNANLGYQIYFSKQNMEYISNEIHNRLLKAGHNMIVTKEVIGNVMSNILDKSSPFIGDIYTRYIIPDTTPRNDLENNNERVINTIVSTIVDQEDARKWNESLSVWDTVYGDFNRKGLRAHSIIRKKDNDYMKGQTNWSY